MAGKKVTDDDISSRMRYRQTSFHLPNYNSNRLTDIKAEKSILIKRYMSSAEMAFAVCTDSLFIRKAGVKEIKGMQQALHG